VREKAPYVTKRFSIEDFKACCAWVSGFKEQYSVVCKTVSREDKGADSNSRAVVKEEVLKIFRVNDLRIFVMLMRLGCS